MIAVWWAGMAVSTRIVVLAGFHETILAHYLSMAFLPMTALMVLGFGYARQWLDAPHSIGGVVSSWELMPSCKCRF